MAKYNITEKKEKEAAYRSLVSPKLMDELEQKINNIIILEKRYKDKDYSAKRLAEDLGTNTRYISAVVNVRFHMNYTSFVNKFRIQEAMSLLVDKRYQELNMEEISDMVGFSNRQSFYASFFKINHMTPRDYKMQHLAQHPALKDRPKTRGRKPAQGFAVFLKLPVSTRPDVFFPCLPYTRNQFDGNVTWVRIPSSPPYLRSKVCFAPKFFI